MSLVVACPHCQMKHAATPELAGKMIRCTRCQGIFMAGGIVRRPAATPGSSPQAPAEPPPIPLGIPLRTRPDEPPPERAAPATSRPPLFQEEPRRRRLLPGILAVVLVGVLVAGGGVLWYWTTRAKPGSTAGGPAVPESHDQDGGQVAARPGPDESKASRAGHAGEEPRPGGPAADPIGPREEAVEPGTPKFKVEFPKPKVGVEFPKDEAAERPAVKVGSPGSPEAKAPGSPPAPARPKETAEPKPEEDRPKARPAERAPPSRPSSASGSLTADVLHKVKNATVLVRVVQASGQVASGSGFFGGEQGLILTNAHVVGMLKANSRPPLEVAVVLNSGEKNERTFKARLAGLDRNADLAILRVTGKDLPSPLEVKSAERLQETQELYIFGFPFGESLGKNITVSKSSVSSLRRDPDNGRLDKVQVNGGMHPGNSGGPVVDPDGNVVGVAVSGIVGTQINFAIPGDFVAGILKGYVPGTIELGQPTMRGGRAYLPVTIAVMDPLKRVREVSVEVWIGKGKPGDRRPPSDSAPEKKPGDGTRTRVELEYKDQTAHGEVALPALTPGKVYWLQPQWINGDSETHWACARVLH
jgi:S1-C subfamily serine protease